MTHGSGKSISTPLIDMTRGAALESELPDESRIDHGVRSAGIDHEGGRRGTVDARFDQHEQTIAVERKLAEGLGSIEKPARTPERRRPRRRVLSFPSAIAIHRQRQDGDETKARRLAQLTKREAQLFHLHSLGKLLHRGFRRRRTNGNTAGTRTQNDGLAAAVERALELVAFRPCRHDRQIGRDRADAGRRFDVHRHIGRNAERNAAGRAGEFDITGQWRNQSRRD